MQGVTWPVTQFQNLVDGKNKKNDFANTFLLLSQNMRMIIETETGNKVISGSNYLQQG